MELAGSHPQALTEIWVEPRSFAYLTSCRVILVLSALIGQRVKDSRKSIYNDPKDVEGGPGRAGIGNDGTV